MPALERNSAACYSVPVTLRHTVLSLAAVLVFGLGVYLFVEVRAQPALPPATAVRASRTPAPAPREALPPRADPAPVTPPRAPVVVARQPSAPPAPEVAAGAGDEPAVGPKLDAAMSEANKAYDRGDFDDAKVIAGRLLARFPTNVRMLRIMVSASCIDGDSTVAQAHYAKLPPADQEQMKVRCARYGITFADKP